MKKQTLLLPIISLLLYFFSPITNMQAQNTGNESDKIYIETQKDFYESIIEMINPSVYEERERNSDFDHCPMKELNDDFLGFNFESIHSEQAGFLDCDGPYLNIYKNGLYINNTGFHEYKCYLKDFDLKYTGLKSGTSKIDIIEIFGLPIIQSDLLYIYGCTLDVDPFAGIEEGSEPEEVDETDPNSYILDFFFIFEDDKLIAIIHHIEHMCY